MAGRNKYRPDYGKLYPGVELSPEVKKVLKQSDRKMRYMEVELKYGVFQKETATFSPSREDSLNRLCEEEHVDFPSSDPTPEEIAEQRDEIERLRKALQQLQPGDYALIHAVFFENTTERGAASKAGITQPGIYKRLKKIYKKLKKFMDS